MVARIHLHEAVECGARDASPADLLERHAFDVLEEKVFGEVGAECDGAFFAGVARHEPGYLVCLGLAHGWCGDGLEHGGAEVRCLCIAGWVALGAGGEDGVHLGERSGESVLEPRGLVG